MAATLDTRTARAELTYRGAALAEHCERLEWTDNAHDTADELRATLEDRDLRWQGPWSPAKGEAISAAIVCDHWFVRGDRWRLDCGAFSIGQVTLTGPPDAVDVVATSSQVMAAGRTERKSRAWEQIDLGGIAAQVAGNAELALVWQGANRTYEHVDQRQETDLGFLRRLAGEAGNSLELADGKLIVYEGKSWDQRPAVGELKRGQAAIKHYRFGTGSHDRYRACIVTYWDIKRQERISGRYDVPGAPPSGEVLQLSTPVRDAGEAAQLARNALRGKNRGENEAEFVLVGDPRRRAGQVLAVAGFGAHDGNFFVDTARHTVDGGGGYETILTMRKVISY